MNQETICRTGNTVEQLYSYLQHLSMHKESIVLDTFLIIQRFSVAENLLLCSIVILDGLSMSVVTAAELHLIN